MFTSNAISARSVPLGQFLCLFLWVHQTHLGCILSDILKRCSKYIHPFILSCIVVGSYVHPRPLNYLFFWSILHILSMHLYCKLFNLYWMDLFLRIQSLQADTWDVASKDLKFGGFSDHTGLPCSILSFQNIALALPILDFTSNMQSPIS